MSEQTSQFEQPSSSERKSEKISRRELLKRLGLLGLGTVIGYSGREIFEFPKKKEIRFYRSNEEIPNPVTSIKINNWRLLFEKSKTEAYLQRFPNRYFRFVLINPKVKQSPELSYRGGFVIYPHSKNNYWEMIALPPGENGIVYLHFTEVEKTEEGKEKLINQEVYPIILDFYTYKPTEEGDKIRIYSEIDLGGSTLKKLHQLSRDFDSFCLPPAVYIFEVERETMRGGMISYDEDRIELSSIIFTHPKFPNEGEMKLFHELSHAIAFEIVFAPEYQRLSKNLIEAYEQLVTKAGWKVPVPSFSLLGPPKEIEDNPYFSIFDESSYIKEKRTEERFIARFGHPYSDCSELFASALTVLRYFPKEFIERYKQLKPDQQETIRLVTRTILESLESINYYAMETLLPHYDLLKKL